MGALFPVLTCLQYQHHIGDPERTWHLCVGRIAQHDLLDPGMKTLDDRKTVTLLLAAANEGDTDAASQLWEGVYAEIRQMAQVALSRDHRSSNLQPTLVVNEVFMRIWPADGQPVPWENRRHFFGSIARSMGQYLIDHARTRRRLKRGGDRKRVPLEVSEGELTNLDVAASDDGERVVAALRRLEESAPDQAEVAWLRYIGGLSVKETAMALDSSEGIVKSDWRYARLWLRRELALNGDPG